MYCELPRLWRPRSSAAPTVCGLLSYYILSAHHPQSTTHLPITIHHPLSTLPLTVRHLLSTLLPPTAYPHQPITACDALSVFTYYSLIGNNYRLPATYPKISPSSRTPASSTPHHLPHLLGTPSHLIVSHYPQGLSNLLAAQAPTRAHRAPSYAAPATSPPTTMQHTAVQRSTCYHLLLDDHLLSDHAPPTTSHLPTNYPLPYPPPSSNHVPPLVL